MLTCTLVYLTQQGKVLLGHKKRSLGAGSLNGFGGKCEGEESPLQCAIRETQEECLVEISETDIHEVGMIRFFFPHKPKWNQDVHIFLGEVSDIDPQETDEMIPQWVDIDNLPLDKMWDDDKFWLPHIFRGYHVSGTVTFLEDGTVDTCKFSHELVKQ